MMNMLNDRTEPLKDWDDSQNKQNKAKQNRKHKEIVGVDGHV